MTEITIPALDTYPLSGLLLEPNTQPKGVIQFHNGTVTRKEFYLDFCTFLAHSGYIVLLFDYRGIGNSLHHPLKRCNASLIDWGTSDMPGVLNWIRAHYPHLRKYIVAHSMGGQLIGLMNNINSVDGIVTIASSYGNWKNYKGFNKYISALLWLFYFPTALSLFSYLPLKKIDMGEDLPRNVALNLWKWSLSNEPHSEKMKKAGIRHYYYEITKPLKAYYIKDDPIATDKAINFYKADFKNAAIDIEMLVPSDYELAKIGHYGFFKSSNSILWDNVIKWLEAI